MTDAQAGDHGPGSPRTGWRRVACRGAAAAAAAVLMVLGSAGVAAGQTPTTRDEVIAAVGADQVAGVLMILVDTSGSISAEDLDSVVAQRLNALADSLPASDQLVVVTFDEDVRLAYRGNAATGSDPDISLPPAEGRFSDIGNAIEDALTRLEAARVEAATVVLLSDGIHDPPPGSRYPSPGGPAWEDLRGRATALADRLAVNAVALGLHGADGGELLESVFPGTETVDIPDEQLGAYLDHAMESVRSAKAGQLLSDDLSGEVTVTWPDAAGALDLGAGSQTLELVLTSPASYLPLTVSKLDVELTGLSDATVEPLEPVGIPPGESVTVPVNVTWSPPQGSLRIGVEETTANGSIDLAGTVSTSWQPALDALGLTPDTTLVEAQDWSGSMRTGIEPWLATVAVVMLVCVAVAAVAAVRSWLARHPVLRGRLEAMEAYSVDGKQPKSYGWVALNGRKVGIGADTELKVPGHGTVRGRNVPVANGQQAVKLVITHSPGGSRAWTQTGICPANESVIVNGFNFRHHLPSQSSDAPSAPSTLEDA